jgi:hypothetical protein
LGSGGDKNAEQQIPANEQVTGESTSTATSSGSQVKVPAPVEKKLTYEQALLIYADKRFQFDSLCQASPAQRVIKNNTEIMLDNRANVVRPIYVDGTRYSLAAYGFKIVKLSSNNLPHTTIIDCGTGKNSAKVILN